MKRKISVAVSDKRWSQNPDAMKVANRVLRYLVADYRVSHKSVGLLLTNKEEMQSLNQQWRGKNASTNVLAFCAASGFEDYILGDIAVSYDHVQDAVKCGKSENSHFAHLLVHAFLHLMGYDHEEDEQARVMETEETRCLLDLGFASPYADILSDG